MCSSRKYPHSPRRATEIQRGGGGGSPKGGNFRGIGGWPLEVFFPGPLSKTEEQAISYFTVSRCFKAKIIVFVDDLLFAVG